MFIFKNWIVFRLKDTPNSPHQMTWPLPRCHSSIETGEGSVSVGVRAPSAGVLAATSVNRTVEPSQMCLCVFAKSTMDSYGHQKCFVGPWLSCFACALVQLHGGVGSGSGSAMGHPGFSLVPSFCFEPAEWSTRSSGTCQELKFGFKQSTPRIGATKMAWDSSVHLIARKSLANQWLSLRFLCFPSPKYHHMRDFKNWVHDGILKVIMPKRGKNEAKR